LIEQEHNALPTPFLVVLIFWLHHTGSLPMACWHRRNLTVLAVMLVCALSLVCELSHSRAPSGSAMPVVESQAFYERFRDKIPIRATLSL
jgi:hypothetical protein